MRIQASRRAKSLAVALLVSLMLLVIDLFGDTVNKLAEKEAWVEVDAAVKNATGDSCKVLVKAGYGTKEFASSENQERFSYRVTQQIFVSRSIRSALIAGEL